MIPGRDLLDGAEDAAFVGGFASAAASLGRAVDLIMLDATDPQRPRARPLGAALARLVRGRVHPRFIAGQMRHGPRGAAELAETVDRLFAFAHTTGAVESALFDFVYDAYLADVPVREFLLRENAAAPRDRGSLGGGAPAAASGTRAATTSVPICCATLRGIAMSQPPRRLSRLVHSDADRRRVAGAHPAGGRHRAGGICRALCGGAPTWQRHHRSDGARQPAGARTDCRERATLCRSRLRHWALRRSACRC